MDLFLTLSPKKKKVKGGRGSRWSVGLWGGGSGEGKSGIGVEWMEGERWDESQV